MIGNPKSVVLKVLVVQLIKLPRQDLEPIYTFQTDGGTRKYKPRVWPRIGSRLSRKG